MFRKVDCEAIQIRKSAYLEVFGSRLTLNEVAAMHELGARRTAVIPEAHAIHELDLMDHGGRDLRGRRQCKANSAAELHEGNHPHDYMRKR